MFEQLFKGGSLTFNIKGLSVIEFNLANYFELFPGVFFLNYRLAFKLINKINLNLKWKTSTLMQKNNNNSKADSSEAYWNIHRL